jgi:hypothetical protein
MTKPSHSALSMQEVTQQSRAITQMRTAAQQCVQRPDLYRDGEIDRMLRRVTQLDRELPLQTLHCRVPESNTLGGFEILSSGTRELAPELHGWYGSPGYQPGKDKQVFFLIGDNFSVHETEVIVGTRKPARVKLLSRQIMEVTVDGDLPVISDPRLPLTVRDDYGRPEFTLNNFEGYVDAHVATPYGVSGHLLIPVVHTPKASDPVLLRPVLSQPPSTLPAPQPGGTAQLMPAQPAVIEVTVPIKFDAANKVYSVNGSLIISQTPIARVTVPAGVGLEAAVGTVTLRPTDGSNRLLDIVLLLSRYSLYRCRCEHDASKELVGTSGLSLDWPTPVLISPRAAKCANRWKSHVAVEVRGRPPHNARHARQEPRLRRPARGSGTPH